MTQPPHFAGRSLKVIPLNKRLIIRPAFLLGLCAVLFLLPIPWLIAWLIAALIHELGHLVSLKLLHIPIGRICIDLSGTYIETGYMTAANTCICALAGPAAGLCCLLFASQFPYLAIFSFVQNLYNLLPFPGFDGGRAFSSVLNLVFSQKQAALIQQCVCLLLSVILILTGFFLWLLCGLGPIMLLICLLPVIKSGILKRPCKRNKQIVQ